MRARLLASIHDVEPAAWDACAGSDNPFVAHAFLAALEDSGCVDAGSGWQTRHLVIEDGARGLVAAAPLYLKSHSFGEYVFDWAWADAYDRAGGQYYPKLQLAVPFTPVPGPRLLVRQAGQGQSGQGPSALGPALAATLIEIARELDVSSLHATFLEPADAAILAQAGFLLRTGLQFHWTNRGYRSFEDFLAALASRKRKAIRKERRDVADAGIIVRPLSGASITEGHWDAFFRFYLATASEKWGQPYLNRQFFRLLGERLGDRVVLMLAEKNGEPLAGALNLRGRDTLYGRNWGAAADYPFLHFESCYYQAIDYAIAHGLARVEAGAQGPHKVQRGYLPVETVSAHWIADPGFRAAVADFVQREARQNARQIASFTEHSPYRNRAAP
ncbi:MAG: GNAT family N-acetyltransferase [Alphaproteobacteria bacterium]